MVRNKNLQCHLVLLHQQDCLENKVFIIQKKKGNLEIYQFN